MDGSTAKPLATRRRCKSFLGQRMSVPGAMTACSLPQVATAGRDRWQGEPKLLSSRLGRLARNVVEQAGLKAPPRRHSDGKWPSDHSRITRPGRPVPPLVLGRADKDRPRLWPACVKLQFSRCRSGHRQPGVVARRSRLRVFRVERHT